MAIASVPDPERKGATPSELRLGRLLVLTALSVMFSNLARTDGARAHRAARSPSPSPVLTGARIPF